MRKYRRRDSRPCGGARKASRASGYHFADQIGPVGDEDGAGSGADHDQQLGGLEEDPRVSMFEQVTAQDGGENRHYAQESKHRVPWSYRPVLEECERPGKEKISRSGAEIAERKMAVPCTQSPPLDNLGESCTQDKIHRRDAETLRKQSSKSKPESAGRAEDAEGRGFGLSAS
jgi:hypothetical protein